MISPFEILRPSLAVMSVGPLPREPGCSLRAEIRRLRRAALDTSAKVDALFSICECDNVIFERLGRLGRSLQQHRELDHLNGRHAHLHGDALRHAAHLLDPSQVRLMKWVKKEGDIARHAEFDSISVPVDVGELLQGMAAEPGPVCGGIIVPVSAEIADPTGDSLLNKLADKHAKDKDSVAWVKVVCNEAVAEPFGDQPVTSEESHKFETDDWVLVDKKLVSIVRLGHCDYAGQARVLRPDESMHSWTAGSWTRLSSIQPVRFPLRLVVATHELLTANDPPLCLSRGTVLHLIKFDSEGVLLVHVGGGPKNHTIFLADAIALEAG